MLTFQFNERKFIQGVYCLLWSIAEQSSFFCLCHARVHSHVLFFCVVQDLGSPTIEEQVDQPTIDDETVLIVPSSHGFIQTTDDIDSESVLPLTTLTGTTVPSYG